MKADLTGITHTFSGQRKKVCVYAVHVWYVHDRLLELRALPADGTHSKNNQPINKSIRSSTDIPRTLAIQVGFNCELNHDVDAVALIDYCIGWSQGQRTALRYASSFDRHHQ